MNKSVKKIKEFHRTWDIDDIGHNTHQRSWIRAKRFVKRRANKRVRNSYKNNLVGVYNE